MNKIDFIQGRFPILAAIISASITIACGMFTTLPPSRFLIYGIFATVVLNIVLFAGNGIKALLQIRTINDDSAVEKIMVPALAGAPSALASKSIEYFRIVTALCLGEIAGSIVLIIIRAVS